MHKNAAILMIVMFGRLELDMEVSDVGIKPQNPMITERCPRRTKMPMVCWL